METLAFQRAFTSSETPLGQHLVARGTSNPIVELERLMNDGPGIAVALSGTNGIGTARDLARMYQLLAQGGELDGVRLLSEAAVETAATFEFDGFNEFWGLSAGWALGLQRTGNLGMRYGVDDSGFGQPGQGASAHGPSGSCAVARERAVQSRPARRPGAGGRALRGDPLTVGTLLVHGDSSVRLGTGAWVSTPVHPRQRPRTSRGSSGESSLAHSRARYAAAGWL
jgi:hypothetical protein